MIWVNKPAITDGSTIYSANTASYGDDEASFAADIVFEFITNNDP